jgi:hypothetical protein
VDSVTRPDQDDIDRALDAVRMGLRDLSLPGEDPFGAIEQIAAEVVALRAELAEAKADIQIEAAVSEHMREERDRERAARETAERERGEGVAYWRNKARYFEQREKLIRESAPTRCRCGHVHAADEDYEDAGCRVCHCLTWRDPQGRPR